MPDLRAYMKPLKHWQEPSYVTCLARTARDKVKVRMPNGSTFAADRFRLFEVRAERQHLAEKIDRQLLDELPWQGSGADPLARFAEAEQARLA